MTKTKTLLFFILAGTVTFTAGLWLYSTQEKLGMVELGVAGIVLILVIFSLVIGYKRLQNEKKGLAVEDELSMEIKQKAAANAFVYSIYLWTMMILFTSDTNLDLEVIIGIGILGMGILFFGFWMYYSKNGIQRENQN